MIDLQNLKELAEKATPGPWDTQSWGDHVHDWKGRTVGMLARSISPSSDDNDVPPIALTCTENCVYDACFISEANPQTVLRLIEVLDAVRVYLEDSGEECSEHCKSWHHPEGGGGPCNCWRAALFSILEDNS